MARNLEIIEETDQLSSKAEELREVNPDMSVADCVVLSRIGGGLLEFANAVFPETQPRDLYAKKYKREPDGRGAHFDVYGDTLDPRYPWLAVYNLAGKASISAMKLPADLADSYFERFPEVDERAFEARRNYSSIALSSDSGVSFTGELDDDTGLLIIQKPEGPHVIHDIIPENSTQPGEFVKLVRPADNDDARELVTNDGMMPLDKLTTLALKNSEVKVARSRSLPDLEVALPDRSSSCGPGLLD